MDEDGFTLTLMKGIIYYKKNPDTAVTKDDAYVVTRCGKKAQEDYQRMEYPSEVDGWF